MTKKMIVLATVLGVLAMAIPAVAGGKEMKMSGWVSCECCAAKNANPEGKDCTIACHKQGKALVLVADGKTYKLSDQRMAAENIGYEVMVTGTMEKGDTIKVSAMSKVEKKS